MAVSGLRACASIIALSIGSMASPLLAQTAPEPVPTPGSATPPSPANPTSFGGSSQTPADAQAADANAPNPPGPGQDTLSDIVVTASRGNQTKLNTSASISTIDSQQIQNFNPTSTAELYRLIPGIQVAGTQGDGGNSNIGVRGLRTPTGGSPFVQIQEDGLPVVLFGDIQFGNNDYWTHADPQTQRIEAIRGGTASTLASQAIGAVLNSISFTDRNNSGYAEFETGLNYQQNRFNARLGGSITDTAYFNIGGYINTGRGIEHGGYDVSESFLVKGNVTQELPDNKGFFRVLFKIADTREPSYNGCITSGTLSGNKVSDLQPSGLCDVRDQAPGYSIFNKTVLFANANGSLSPEDLGGISTRQRYVQTQLHYELTPDLTIDDNARIARMSGTFAVQFYGAGLASGALGGTYPGGIAQSIIYADGPNAGKVFTGAYVSNSASVHTNMNHMDHEANDLRLTYNAVLGSNVKLDVQAGYLYFAQRIAEDWHSNNSLVEATGNNPAQLDLVSGPNGTGNLLSVGGQSGFNESWNQQFDTTFTDNAPYADVSLTLGRLNIDGSVREEFFHGSGYAQGTSGAPSTVVAVNQIDPRTGLQVTTLVNEYTYNAARENINFSESTTNYSGGLLYKLFDNLSVFGRATHAVRFNADRLTGSPSYFNADGSLSAAGQANARFPVTQYELGLKNRGGLLGGSYTIELTGFYSKYSISSQEISQTNCLALLGINEQTCIISGNYHDKGVELFTTYRNHGFNVLLSATYDDSKVAATQNAPFIRSPNIPRITYTSVVSYDVRRLGQIGVSVNGQTSVPDGNQIFYPASALLGAFLHVTPLEHIQVGVDVYNLLNSVSLQGVASVAAGSGSNTLFNAGAAQGRAVKASVRLSF